MKRKKFPYVRYVEQLEMGKKYCYDFRQLLDKAVQEYERLEEDFAIVSRALLGSNREIQFQHNQENQQYSLCNLSKSTYDACCKFKEIHAQSCGNSNHFVYDLFEDDLGAIIKIGCPVCGKKVDISYNILDQ